MSYICATNADLAEQNKALASSLDSTRGLYEKVVGETEDYMRVLNSRKSDQTEFEDIMSQELDNLKAELERMDRLVIEKDVKIVAISKKLERLESERKLLESQREEERRRADNALQQLSNYQRADRKGTLVVKCEIETQHVQSEERVSQLQDQLDKVLSSNRASKDLIEQMKDDKSRLEQELDAIKSISSRRLVERESEQKRHTVSETERMRLSRLEVRNAQLDGEIHEKSHQSQQLAIKISELTDQVDVAHRKCQREKQTRQEVEESLRERITELEQRLAEVSEEADTLRTESLTVSDNEPENKRILTEQEQTIAILQANVEKLENLVVGMREGFDEKEQRRDQRGRQETRRWAEIVGELKQENMYLERKIEHLNAQLQAKADFENTHKERLKSVRGELKEVKATAEAEIKMLNKRVLEAEVKMSDAKSEATTAVQTQNALQRRFENLQNKLEQNAADEEQRRLHMQNEKQKLCDQIEILKEETELIDELEKELTRLAEKNAALDAENKSLKDQTRRAVEGKTTATMHMDKLQQEKRTIERRCDSANEELRKLKQVCSEMESHTEDLERLVDDYEHNHDAFSSERKDLANAVTRLQNKTERLEASLQAERNQREAIDERNERMKQSLQSQIVSHRSKEESLHEEIERQRKTLERLRQQVQSNESNIEQLDTERRSIKVRLSQAENEIRKLKEETATWKTQVSNLKASNCSLSTDLEIVMEKLQEVTDKKNAVENSMENLVLTKEHESYKSEQMLSQQTKLIDFLQEKYEAPIKKKKWGSQESNAKMFPKKREGQRDEFSQALESERSRNRRLQDEVKELKTSLFETKISSKKGMRDPSSHIQSSLHRPEPVGDCGSASETADSVSLSTTQSSPPKVSKGAAGSSNKTMKHNIPHRMSVRHNTRATKCAVCQSIVMFGQQAAKCQECRIVTHEHCKSELPATCGLPSQFMQLYSNVMRKENLKSVGGVLEADLRLVELGGWMKVRGNALRDQSSGWIKRFVLIESQLLSIYSSDDTSKIPLFQLDLCPEYDSVCLISDINPAELHVSAEDLPYIIKLEQSSVRGSKLLYLLTANFSEKEKWDSTLEAIIKCGNMADVNHRENKLLGNRLLQLAGQALLDVNCTTLLGENDILLLGAEEGLYACQLSYTSAPLIKVEGISSVYQISRLCSPDSLLMITGHDKWLKITSYSTLLNKLSNQQNAISGTVAITTEDLGRIKNCNMFTVGEAAGRCFVVAAMENSVAVLSYSSSQCQFSVIQEVQVNEPCSCVCYTPDFVLLGMDTVYKLTIKNGCIRSFLASGVKEDTSYHSFPIDILSLAADDSREGSYLCCFTDVGVFVNSRGERSGLNDIQWSGLPLSFAYRAPYLYVLYYKAIQVIGLQEQPLPGCSRQQTFLNIQSPRFLGPAYTDGAVYIASLQDACTDIVVFKGNLSTPEQDTQDVSSISTSSQSEYLPQKKNAPEFYLRNNKENHPRNRIPSMIQR
ncbi:citron rho-interacting kinase-like isoform X2 [Watersipora subatra]|uniref:citron rho-interacting kinase-like isoform X2 n=1 Tax=Watersipora subatra TaxID=2589382 RepID=UPI00355AF7B7